MAQRYLIRNTYLEGPHKGTSYLMRKGGYVAGDTGPYFLSDTYVSYGIALRQCRRMADDNKLNCRLQKQDHERLIKQGKKPGIKIYYQESYEPVPVDTYEF